MIDFKYHLVSLMSVFMALAIGIVLGAGPLQESIGNSLAEQVSALRTDKQALQSATRAQQELLDDYDTYLGASTRPLIDGALAGKRVVLVRLQNASDADVQAVQDDILDADATVTGTVNIAKEWAAADSTADRTKGAAALAKAVGDPGPSAAASGAYLNRVLGELIAVRDPGALGTERPRADAAMASLRRSGLLSVSGSPVARGSVVLAVSGGHTVLVDPKAQERDADQQTQEAYIGLLQAVRGQSRATVLAGPRRSTTVSSLVADLRADNNAAEAISGVDDIDHPMGRVSSVLVARSAGGGTIEQCGTAGDAKNLLPATLAASPSTAP